MHLRREHAIDLALALCAGVALRYAFGLHPLWWLAWLAPVPLLVAALRSTPRAAFALTLLAALIGTSADFHYFTLVMPLPAALIVTVLSTLPWLLAVGVARRVMQRSDSGWTVLAFPLLVCAVDTLLAHLHPDGNWGSLAYSQAGFPAAVQVVALAGVAGLVFLLALVPAVLALAVTRDWRAARVPALCTLALVAASFAFGALRLAHAPSAQGDVVGLAVIDDFMGPNTPAAYNERIWAQYERHVTTLAGQGARIVVLPERLALLAPGDAAKVAQRLSALAARTRVWLAVGIGTDDGHARRNLAWLFAPDGRLDASYQKHHLAPPEREFAPGSTFDLRTIAGTRYGLAICKDMHFAEMGRAYGGLRAQALLVPAWDFGEDGEYAARMSALRGVESGFAMVRAARDGLLTVTDAYGRIVAETRSAGMPGTTLLARVSAQAPLATLYARTGDVFGWLCVAGALRCIWLAWRRAAWPAATVEGVARMAA